MGKLLQDNGYWQIADPTPHVFWRLCFVCIPGVARLLRPRVCPPFSMFTTEDLAFLVTEIIDELDRRYDDPDLEDDCDLELEPECGLHFGRPGIRARG